MVVIFDVVGTLFSLERVEDEFRAQGLPPDLPEIWFARLLMTAMAATLVGRYLPFSEAAEAALRQLLVARGLPDDGVGPVLAVMRRLAPWPDAGQCLSALQEDGHRVLALTNSSSDAGTDLIVEAGLADFFETVLSADEARACKPHPAAYRTAAEKIGVPAAEVTLVAAHGWDVLGAAASGLETVWVSRLERRWPFPGEPPGQTAPDLAGVPAALAARSAVGEA